MSRPFRMLSWLGWFIALVLACVIAPKAYRRLVNHVPSLKEREWEDILAEKEKMLSVPWKDGRPLILMTGDSQIELGDWYALFSGALAVRNCGLSQAKIEDVTRLMGSITDRQPKGVVLMCGVNNLSTGESPESCLKKYQALLVQARSLRPEFILVLSVMPVRESEVDRKSQELNQRIRGFNSLLADHCRSTGVPFCEVSDAIRERNGGLAADLTFDGLHLNPNGYRRLSARFAPDLLRLAGVL